MGPLEEWGEAGAGPGPWDLPGRRLLRLCLTATERGGYTLHSLAWPGIFSLESRPVPATIITLQCGECRERNYTTQKNKRNDPDRVELRKYCRRCRRHTAHRETK